MVGVFDWNGTGMVNRAEFVKMIKALKINIPLEKCRILLNYIDQKTGNSLRGII